MKPKNRYFAYRSFWPELETMKKFHDEVGIDVFNVMISNTANSLGFPYTKYPPVWKWNGVYDLEAFDRQLDDLIGAVPEAKFICMLDLNTPLWWTRYLGAFGVRYDSYYDLGKISASETWRTDTTEYMRIVMEHAQEKYGDRIVAYVLGCGGATEWHDRSRSEESIYKLHAFQKWQLENGKELSDIPGHLQRDRGSYDFITDYHDPDSYYNGNDPTGGAYNKLFPQGYGLFRTPEKDQEVIDYFRFCNEFNADTVSFFLNAARKTIPREVELGVFFGYSFGAWTITAGHLEYERLFKDDNLDFIIAPVTNYKMGDGGTSATVHETISLHNKRMLQEMDQRTYCCNRVMNDYCELPDHTKVQEVSWDENASGSKLSEKFTYGAGLGWIDQETVAAGIKRDGAMTVINGNSLWWFDMWGGFYQGEKVFSALRSIKKIWDEERVCEADPAAEILMVYDPENLYLLNELNERCGVYHTKVRNWLAKSGFPFEAASFNDLNKLELERYKFIILCHPFALGADKMSLLQEKVFNKNRTVMFLHGPSINDHGQWDESNVEKICGIPFATPGVSCKAMGNWKSVYIHRPEKIDDEMLMRELALEAGCHSYCSKPRPVCANSRLVCVHTASAESLTVSFPHKHSTVTELFSGQEWHNVDSVQLTTKGPETCLFKLH